MQEKIFILVSKDMLKISMLANLDRKIILFLLIILGLFWTGFFLWMEKEQEDFFLAQMRRQALGIYHYVILTRRWISSKDGIFIKDKEKYKLITPSAFTEEIGVFARSKLPYSLKVAVPDPSNPFHAPDQFELDAINQLKNYGKKEVWKLESGTRGKFFRYAAPLTFANECASCHPGSLKPGILGCISISFPAEAIYETVAHNRRKHGLYLAGTLAIALLLLWGMLRTYVLDPLKQLACASRKIEKGQLDVRVDLNQAREWAHVGKSFNRMVQHLADQQKRLEKAVKEAVGELASAYMELKRTEQFKNDFFSNITHDLKTPITAIKGAVDILQKKIGGADTDIYLEILQRNTKKLSEMVGDLLDCAKIESGSLELQKESHDIAEVVEDAIVMVMPLSWEKKVKINYEVPANKIMVTLDRARMEQAISNLLANAIKFSKPDEKIEVKVEQRDGEAIISVKDYGPGIPEEERKLVFEKFFRRSKTENHDGIGLGLAIAKWIVEAHGGRIWVEEPDHQGSLFLIALKM